MGTRGVLLLALVCCSASPARAWDPFGIFKSLRDKIEDAGKVLIGEAKKAVEEVMNDLFDNKLPKFVDKVSSAVADLMDHAEHDAELLLNYTVGNITNLMEEGIDLAGKMVNQSVQEIKQALDDFVDTHLTELLDHIFEGVNELLTRVEKDVQQLVCEEQAIVKQLELFIDGTIGSLDCGCALDVKTTWGQPCQCTCSKFLPTRATCHCSPSNWITVQDLLAYEYIECVQRKAIEGGQLPVGKITDLLGGLRSLAEQLRCYHVAPDGPKAASTTFYTSKILNISKEMYIWKHPDLAKMKPEFVGLKAKMSSFTKKTVYI